MNSFSDLMYYCLRKLMGDNLYFYLQGDLLTIALSLIIISMAVVLIFYYLVNHPKLNNWWGWGIFLVSNAIINFFVGWRWCISYIHEHGVGDSFANYSPDIDMLCIKFGISNMILSLVAFFVFSLIVKWWSTNCSSAPFSR